jgi:hypothetical protein
MFLLMIDNKKSSLAMLMVLENQQDFPKKQQLPSLFRELH